jgi:hypothetical protein
MLKYGVPTECIYCGNESAFQSSGLCHFCSESKKKYGDPVECWSCKKKAAFKKPQDKLEKVLFYIIIIF